MADCSSPSKCPIDQIEFGQLIQSVSTLTAQVAALSTKVETMSSQITGGRGVILGLMMAAGGVGAGASHVVERLFK